MGTMVGKKDWVPGLTDTDNHIEGGGILDSQHGEMCHMVVLGGLVHTAMDRKMTATGLANCGNCSRSCFPETKLHYEAHGTTKQMLKFLFFPHPALHPDGKCL